MREIKFRFYSNITKEMYTEMSLIGLQYRYNNDPEIYVADKVPDEELGGTRVQKYSDGHLMQYIGLKDVNDTEIYEGDIVEFNDADGAYTSCGCEYEEFTNVGKIIFEEGAFGVTNRQTNDNALCEMELRVIGNIYENPELLEG